MNTKRWIGLVILVLGVAGFIYSRNAAGRVARAKSDVNFFTDPIKDKPVGREITGALKDKASSYDGEVMFLTIGSLIFIVVGTGMLIFCKNRRRKH